MCRLLSSPCDLVSLSHLTCEADFITLDTETGLRWLDVPISLSRSYNAVAAHFGAGGDEGFRHATPSEVTSLFNSFWLVK